MGPRLLCFASGGALAAFYVHVGLLATPFFGPGSFLGASLFASFLLALALGFGLGDGIAWTAGRSSAERSAARLALSGGLAAFVSAYALPDVCRWALRVDPDGLFAPVVSMTLCTLIPGSLIAAVVPSEIRVRMFDCDGKEAGRSALRLLGLMTLGGVVGTVVSGAAAFRPGQAEVWLEAYAVAGGLAALGAVFLGKLGRVVAGVALLGLVGLCALRPSEIQDEQFAVALDRSWAKVGAGAYFLATDHETLLTQDELRARTERIRKAEKPGVILTCELLERLGEVSVTGEGLRGSLDLLLPPDARRVLMPIFDQFESVRSDGKGHLSVEIRRVRGEEGTLCRVPGEEPGDSVEIRFLDDFTVDMIHEPNVWKLQFGPVTIESAGVFDIHDTRKTPIHLPDIKLWVDAHLLGILIEEQPDQIVVYAIAQGDIGAVQTVELAKIKKD
ncbi:MAG: hypothetical protein KDD82_04205 [Planctomycetes bacterium]|nr:hypothetical protein [Planctomycetota bacterium]